MHIIYITTSSKDEALKISKTLLEEETIACANIIDGMTSVYKWEGEVCEGSESVLLLKTPEALLEKAIGRVKELHSYDCPCIASIKIDNCDKDFLKWVELSVKLPY